VKPLVLKALAVGTFFFLVGAAFAAYLQPGMLIQFANLVLCY
jgi:hypothetical protein